MNYKIALIIFGASMLYIGIRALIQYVHETKHSYVTTTATIVESKKSMHHNAHSHAGYIGYTPVFEYTYNGRTYREEHRVTSSKYNKDMDIVPASKYKIGDTVEVRVYDKNGKVYAVINDEKNIKSTLYIGLPLTIIGGIFVAVGIYLYI